jgi:hypothetical protein
MRKGQQGFKKERGKGLLCQYRHGGLHLYNENSITGLLMLFVLRSRGAIRLGLFCVAVLRANDPPFAALSSSYQKYHNHALFLLLIPTLLAMNKLRWKYTIS